jgi:hypothetical protein
MFILFQSMKTRVIKSTLNPIWNERLMLSIPDPVPPLKLVSPICFEYQISILKYTCASNLLFDHFPCVVRTLFIN